MPWLPCNTSLCGHFNLHPIIKALSEHQISSPFLSLVMWRFHTDHRKALLLLTFTLGQNIAHKTSCVFENSWINHIKQLGNKSGGWQRETNTAISHCTPLVSRHGWRRVCLLRNISHTVKTKRTYRRYIQRACKQVWCSVVIYNKHRSKSTKWTSVSESTMRQNLFPPKTLTLDLPTLIDKITISRVWKVRFFFFF